MYLGSDVGSGDDDVGAESGGGIEFWYENPMPELNVLEKGGLSTFESAGEGYAAALVSPSLDNWEADI